MPPDATVQSTSFSHPKNLPPPTEPGGINPNDGAPPTPPVGSQRIPIDARRPTQEYEQPPPTSEQSDAEQRQGQPPAQGQSQHTKADEAREQLREAINQSNQVLITKQTIAPFFNDIVTIDRAKVTVAKRGFAGTAEVMSIRVEDLLNVTADLGIFFGSIHITNRVSGGDKPTNIGPLKRSDALAIKRITQGYVIALQRSIDVSELTCNELRTMLEKLGEDDHPNTLTNEPED